MLPLLLCLLVLLPAPLHAQRFIAVVISENINAEQSLDVMKSVLAVFQDRICQGGDTLHVSTGSGKRIAAITLPPQIKSCEEKFNRWKMQTSKEELLKIAQFFRNLKERDYQGDDPGGISIPDVLGRIAQRLPEFKDLRKDLIIVGTAIHRQGPIDLTSHSPSQGHIDDPFSPWFVSRQRRNALQATDVHIIHQPHEFKGPIHKRMLEQFNAIYIQSHAGRLVTFAADPNFGERLTTPALPGIHAERNPHDTESVLISLNRKVITKRDISNVHEVNPDAFVIWIEYSPEFDLDLYTPRNKACSIEISKDAPVCTSGRHPLLVSREENDQTGYEKVIIHEAASPESLRIKINYAKGSGRATGRFHAQYQGRLYQTAFSFRATRGNAGALGDDAWVEIDLGELIRVQAGGLR